MTGYTEADVKQQLQPFHDRIRAVIERGYADWLSVKRFMAESGMGPALYPRTIANFVFDCVVKHAKSEFGDDEDVRVIEDPQTVKFVFGDVVLARFKKGDEANLGQNHPTQAVFDFISAQSVLPGFSPSAAKVELLYSSTDIGDEIESVIVAARDGNRLLWHYDIVGRASMDGVLPFPVSPRDDQADDEPLVTPRIVDKDTEREGE